MCSLCGMLGSSGHWTNSYASPETFAARVNPVSGARERHGRVALLNKVLTPYHLKVSPWTGESYVLKNRTGKTVLVDNLSHLWAQAELLSGRELDPLNDDLINALEQ